MADITMCNNEDCPRKSTCYRALAKPDPHMQSYFSVLSWQDCRHYWEYKEGTMKC